MKEKREARKLIIPEYSLGKIPDLKFDYILIGNIDNVLINLPAALKKAGFKVLVIAPRETDIFKSQHISARVAIPGLSIEEFLNHPEFFDHEIRKIQGTFLWCSDEIMKKVAESNLSMEAKIHVLPLKDPRYWTMFDSKIGQAQALNQLGIPQPEYSILENRDSIDLFEWGKFHKIVLKGDSSGGGAFVKVCVDAFEGNAKNIPATWFPVLVQEFVDSEDVAIEAYFKDGTLICAVGSSVILESSKHGPSVVRHYRSELVQKVAKDLARMGTMLKIDGFINISCRYNANRQESLIFEFDARPNVWHGVFDSLGIEVTSQWSQVEEFDPTSVNYDKKLYEPRRLFNWSLENRDIKMALEVLKSKNFDKYGNAILSDFTLSDSPWRAKARLLASPIYPYRKLLLRKLIRIKKRLPSSLNSLINSSRIKRKLLKILN